MKPVMRSPGGACPARRRMVESSYSLAIAYPAWASTEKKKKTIWTSGEHEVIVSHDGQLKRWRQGNDVFATANPQPEIRRNVDNDGIRP